jgi:hypothetical protein
VRKLLSVLWATVLLGLAQLSGAQSITSPNAVSPDITIRISLTPLDAGGNPITALTQAWPASPSIQTVTNFVFPAQAAPYQVTGIRADISIVGGTGFAVKQAMLLDYKLTPLTVPAQVPLLLTVNAPAIGLGSLVASLGADTSPPSAPVLSAVATQTAATISWTAGTDNVGVMSYLLERAPGTLGAFTQIALTSALTFSDSGLTSATVYSYRVRAADAAGNFSPYSATVTVVTSMSPAPPGATSVAGDCVAAVVNANWGCNRLVPQLTDKNAAVWTLSGNSVLVNGKDLNVQAFGYTDVSMLITQSNLLVRIVSPNHGYFCLTTAGVPIGC